MREKRQEVEKESVGEGKSDRQEKKRERRKRMLRKKGERDKGGSGRGSEKRFQVLESKCSVLPSG